MTGVEPLLLGAAAAAGPTITGATLASTAGGAATAGLFGAGGAFSLMSTLGTLSSALPFFMGGQANSYDATAGQLQAGAAEMEALQLESQAEFEKTRAMQEQSNRRQKLNEILNKQMAMTAGRGIAIGSGSDLAISSFSEQEFEEESDIANTDSKFRQQQLRQQAQQARLGGQGSLLSSRSRISSRNTENITRGLERVNTSNIGNTFKTAFG